MDGSNGLQPGSSELGNRRSEDSSPALQSCSLCEFVANSSFHLDEVLTFIFFQLLQLSEKLAPEPGAEVKEMKVWSRVVSIVASAAGARELGVKEEVSYRVSLLPYLCLLTTILDPFFRTSRRRAAHRKFRKPFERSRGSQKAVL